MNKLTIKTPSEIEIMAEGGKRLARVKEELKKKVKEGVSAWEIETLAFDLIKKEGAEASFKMVPGYSWATCVNVNSGIVHGIPKPEVVFKKGDVVSVDVGIFYKGFHVDTSFTEGLGVSPEICRFLQAGKEALQKAIEKVRPGNKVYDISQAIQETIELDGYSPIRALVGHGVGRNLHEDPQIPCFTYGKREDSLEIVPGMVFAIEVMYALGSSDVATEPDGWTIVTQDGKISALFEETVATTTHGPLLLTT